MKQDTPFGPEWEYEMKKFTKDELIEKIKKLFSWGTDFELIKDRLKEKLSSEEPEEICLETLEWCKGIIEEFFEDISHE